MLHLRPAVKVTKNRMLSKNQKNCKKLDENVRNSDDLVRPGFAVSEIARVLVPFDHVASRIVNANHGVM
jgi:hypothetical protein